MLALESWDIPEEMGVLLRTEPNCLKFKHEVGVVRCISVKHSYLNNAHYPVVLAGITIKGDLSL